MKRTIRISLTLAILAVAWSIAPPPAVAQPIPSPTIAVLDVQRVLRESKGAKSVLPQMEKLRSGFQKSVRDKESELRKADRELSRKRAILAPEAYATRRREFENTAKDAQRQVQIRKRKLDRAFAKAMGTVRAHMIKVAKAIATERKINIVLIKSAAVLSMKSLDITEETLKRLDKGLPKVTVTVAEKK